MSRRVGEVVEAASTSLVAQCYRLYAAPPLGSFVRTDSPRMYAVVCRVTTGPVDPGRPVLARGEAAASEEEVYRDNPQLARLFSTRFEALIAGHWADGVRRQFLPPLPPPVHSFVYTCSPAEVAEFTADLDFLHLLLHSGLPIVDEVVGACLRAAASAHDDGPGFLARSGKTLALELAGDVARLSSILRRVAP